MKKKDLEIKLESIPAPKKTKPSLEQYITPAPIAADIIFIAHLNDDIQNKKIIDLGCGTGIFAIGAYITGASTVTAIDIDMDLLKIAKTYTKNNT